ncbi:hypothetical protein [Fibrobacter sp.]|uniref:hypothetical protein n=1 Tax=Fibrobacter sp. TaxID=35828 RepID=UPI00386E16E0
MTIKEYATARGKTIQAVYQAMRRKVNAEALVGHTYTTQIRGKNVLCLDDEAVKILDKGAMQTATVVEKATDEMLIAKYAAELEAERKRADALQAELNEANRQLRQTLPLIGTAEVQQKRLEESEERTQELEAALASEKEAGEAAEKRALEAEHRADLAEQAAGYEKSRADSAEAKVQEFNSLGFWQRLFWKG